MDHLGESVLQWNILKCLSFVIAGVYGGMWACEKYSDRCGDLWKDQDVIFIFSYYTKFVNLT